MSRLPSIPDVPLEIPENIREILEPMRTQLDYLTSKLKIDSLPVVDPKNSGDLWIDNGFLKVSDG